MKSYKQIYRKLPEAALQALAGQFTPNDLDKVLAGFMVTRPLTLRVNRLKTDVRQVMTALRHDNIKFERVLWYDDALVIRNVREKTLEAHELYQEGHIYFQSLSSMIPALVLQPRPGAKVLDLTAAPGGKTTQMAAMMNNDGYILANELNAIRAERLRFNIERQGVAITEVRQGDGKRLDSAWKETFDFVLLDAPCSGMGLFATEHPQTYRGWSLKQVQQLVKEQRKLLEKAFWALKPGGKLVYSTCTLMGGENEANAGWILERLMGQISLEPLDFSLTGAEAVGRDTRLPDHPAAMLTVLPSALYEGFFVAKFIKHQS